MSVKTKSIEDEAQPLEAPSLVPRARSVTARAMLLGMLLMPVNAYWVVQMETVRYSAHPTTISLFFNCVFILVVLAGANSLVRRFCPSWAFAQGELLLVYSMLCIGSCMAGHDCAQILVPSLTWPYAQANAGNGYQSLFWRFLPKWAMMSDNTAARGFWLGNSTLYTKQHLLAWLPATLVWTAFAGVLLWVMQCVNVLIRKQWTENERLTYPLVKIPMEITDSQPFGRGQSGVPLTRNKLFWIGFAVAFSIDLVNSLNYYFPAIPPIGTPGNGASSWDLHWYVTTKPWNAIGWTPLSFYPFMIGIGMLMPMDFLFSSWFFYLFWKAQQIVVAANAWDADPKMPYANYQGLGAYLLFFVSTIWLSRPYLAQVLRRAFGRPTELNDTDEPLRYRTALLGLAGGLLILICFSMALGMAWWLAVAFFTIYLALALAITRMRAELGTPVHDLHFTGPDWTLTDLLGPRALGPQSLAAFSLFYWFNRAYRGHPMPHQLEAFKMAEQTGQKKEMRGWFWALLLAGVFGMICAFWAMLHCYYIYGGTAKISVGTAFGSESWDRYAGWMKNPQGPNGHVAVAIGVGFLFAMFLQAMRVRFAWWPFHPLAYAVSGSWEMNLLWLPLFIAWVVKSAILRFAGGINGYRTAMPFFYGLIMGQFIPGSLLNIWGIITHNQTYQFWQ
jgi:hypothetical protein